MRKVLSIMLALSVAAPWAVAQRPARADSLPRELVLALMGGGMGPEVRPEVIPDLADGGLPAALFAGARVLGHAAYPRSRTTVAVFPYESQAAADTVRARLLRAGWKAPPGPSTEERGFVGSYGSMLRNVLCGDGAVILPTVTPRDAASSLAVVSRQETGREDDPRCGADASIRRATWNQAADTPLPALRAPAGMRSRGGGSSGTVDRGLELTTDLEGPVPLPEIHRHYARQFLDAGWHVVEEVLGARVGLTVFEITDGAGARWHCVLSSSAPSGAAVADVAVTLRRS